MEDKTPRCGTTAKCCYDTSTHLYALVLILVLSTLACGFPLLTRKVSKHARLDSWIFLSQHFGTGVLIATAFVHLLPTAFMSLTNPCLSSFFNKKYPPLAGLIAMISVLFVVGLEMHLTMRGVTHSHSCGESNSAARNERRNYSKKAPMLRQPREKPLGKSPIHNAFSLQDIDASEELLADHASTPPVISISRQTSHSTEAGQDDLECQLEQRDVTVMEPFSEYERINDTITENSRSTLISPVLQQERQILQCFMLEAGILFHSIFIGMALSVATGPPFVVFLIAIAFHQSFEGMALGSRIAAIEFPSHSPRPWLMVLAYGITTPIGQALGLAMHNLYDPQSAAGLLVVGVMNGISSGLLLYAGLVQLLAEDFLSSKSYRLLKGMQRTKAFCSVVAGALLMALVGAWA